MERRSAVGDLHQHGAIPPLGATFALRTGGDPLALSNAARKALATIDPALPLDNIETCAAFQLENPVGLIYAASMLVGDAVFALLLAAIGIFAVTANLVAERTREIGLRMAMGARRTDVLSTLLSRAGRLTVIGLTIGLATAFVLAHLVASLLPVCTRRIRWRSPPSQWQWQRSPYRQAGSRRTTLPVSTP